MTQTFTVAKAPFFEQIGYKPHSAGQWSYHNSTARFRVPVCGRRYGKSTMAAKDREAILLNPSLKQMGWIVGPTYDLGEKEFRVIWNDLIVGAKLGREKNVKKAYRKNTGEMYIEFPWGTRLEVRSATHPETLVGESLDFVIMSEAAKHDKETFERYIRPALADRKGSADFPTTPEGFNWLYDLWALGQNPDFPEYESWRFPSWDNPVIYKGGRQDPEILLMERTMAPEWFEQEIGAGFSTFVGRIFGEFTEETHVKKLAFNPNWPNYITFDWGFANPLAAIEFQVDPMGRVYIWREHHGAYKTLHEHVQILKDRDQPEGYHLDLAFGDAADPEAAAVISQILVPCIADPMAKTNWREGVDLIKTKLKEYPTGSELDEFGTPENEPHLLVDFSCANLRRELLMYRAKDKLNSSIKESGTNSAAVKQDDHCLDALRYGLVHVFILGAHHHLEDLMWINKAERWGIQGNRDDGNETFFSVERSELTSNADTFFSFTSGRL